MANTPKKMKDPTEAALSAIQDALNVRDPEPATETAATPPAPPPVDHFPDEPPAEPTWRARSGSTAREPAFDDEVRSPDDVGSMRRPANDDRESIGQILRSIQRRPARTSYLVATVFAVVWVLAGILLGWMYLPDLKASLG